MELRSRFIGVGSYLPEKVLTNDDLPAILETSHEWIMERTGIAQRHIAATNELTSDLGYQAALKALEYASISPQSIDLIIVATSTPDRTFPSTAVEIQSKLGIYNGFAFDLQAVCSGFLYALITADNFIKAGSVKRVLVIGAEIFSRIVDWNDRSTCILLVLHQNYMLMDVMLIFLILMVGQQYLTRLVKFICKDAKFLSMPLKKCRV
jgi:3-oxoacyl-[acyl-carrier-protein] synthase III